MKSLEMNKEIPSIAATGKMLLKIYKKRISIWQNQFFRMVDMCRQKMMGTEKRNTQEILFRSCGTQDWDIQRKVHDMDLSLNTLE